MEGNATLFSPQGGGVSAEEVAVCISEEDGVPAEEVTVCTSEEGVAPHQTLPGVDESPHQTSPSSLHFA